MPPADADDVAADDEALPLAGLPHVPDVALPANEVPSANPPPSKLVLAPARPDDEVPPEVPVPEQIAPLPATPAVSTGAGLRLGDGSSVAPMPTPVGETDKPGVMPSGDVEPIPGVGLPIPPTCAKAGLPPKGAASIATIIAHRIIFFLS
jgi:hypothetical protein